MKVLEAACSPSWECGGYVDDVERHCYREGKTSGGEAPTAENLCEAQAFDMQK